MKLHKFQECVQKKAKDIGKSKAHKECNKIFHATDKLIKGRVLKKGKPEHNLYDISENSIHKINKLLRKYYG